MARAASRRDLVGLRLSAQLLSAGQPRTAGGGARTRAAGGTGSAPDAVSHAGVVAAAERLLAVQAQDYMGGKWALGVRAPGSSESDVIAALNDGLIVRAWPMRGTLHFVPASELNWMLSLTTARMITGTATRRRQLELDEGTIERARDVAIAALDGGGMLNRAGFMAALEAAGIATGGQRGYHLIWHLAQTGTLCWGPQVAGAQMLVLLSDWVPSPRVLERDEALGEFLVRYIAGHGPAMLTDFAWWSKLTIADAKRARAVAAGLLGELVVDGRTYLVPVGLEVGATPPTRQRLPILTLGPFDEYLIGYQDRGLIIDPDLLERVVPGKNGMFLPLIVSNGRIVGTWRRDGVRKSITVQAAPFTAQSKSASAGFLRGVREYGRFFDVGVTVASASPNEEQVALA